MPVIKFVIDAKVQKSGQFLQCNDKISAFGATLRWSRVAIKSKKESAVWAFAEIVIPLWLRNCEVRGRI
jgi:hypothetical protein